MPSDQARVQEMMVMIQGRIKYRLFEVRRQPQLNPFRPLAGASVKSTDIEPDRSAEQSIPGERDRGVDE